jgi:type I restriction enzyme S subunit
MKKLPKGWERHELGKLGRWIGGGTPARAREEFWAKGTIPWVSPKDMRTKVISNSEEWITENAAKESATNLVPKDSILVVTRSGILRRILPVAITGRQVAINQDIKALLPFSETDSRFILHTLQGFESSVRRACMKEGTTVESVDLDSLKEFVVAVPPLPEQHKIANILSTWDTALEKLDALIVAQERRKKALMQLLLFGRKRFPTFAKKPWKKVRMNYMLKRVFRPIDWSAEMSLSLISLRRRCGGLFRRPDLLGADYKTQDLHELHADDFLISKRQVAHGAWGLVTSEFTGSHVSKEYAILVNTAPEKLHMPFFAWLCQTPRMIGLSRVASTGVHIEKLIFDPDVFLRDSIRIPSDIEEQRQISAILDAADQLLKLLRTQHTALDQQKRGLMQRLLTGKLRVKS